MRDALIIVPTYNEAENLEPLCAAIFAQSDRCDILVVDDASPDGTGALADRLARDDSRVTVLHRARKEGLGQAYLAGFAVALERGYRLILEMDADFSHDPAYLPQLMAAAEDADLVLGSRYVQGGGTQHWGIGRRLISLGGSLYARTILGVRVRDLTGGFKCFRRETLLALDLATVQSEGYAFQIELTYRALCLGLKVVEIPIVFADRRVGKSKMSRAILLEAIPMVWRLRAQRRSFLARAARSSRSA
jgi:dolichol-phosphate mannosyltransferase